MIGVSGIEKVKLGKMDVYPIPMRGLPGGNSCDCYVVVSCGECVLIDSGVDVSASAISGALRDLDARLVAIVNTHGHVDHIAGNSRLMSESGTALMVPAGERYLIENYSEASKEFRGMGDLGEISSFFTAAEVSMFMNYHRGLHMAIPAVSSARGLSEADVIEFGDLALEVIGSPGHSPGHICLIEGESGTLWSGDALLADSMAYAGGLMLEPGEPGSVGSMLDSLEKLSRVPFDALFSSSGLTLEGGRDRAERTIEYYRDLEERLLGSLSAGPLTLEETAGSLFGEQANRMAFFLKRSATRALVEKLASEGRINVDGGRFTSTGP